MNTLPQISPELIKKYQEEISRNSSGATAKRKSVSLNRFFDWAEGQGKLEQNPLAQTQVEEIQTQSPAKKKSSKFWPIISLTTSVVVLVVLLLWKIGVPIPFTITPAQELNKGKVTVSPTTGNTSSIPASSAVIGSYNLFTKLELASVSGAVVTTPQTATFSIYKTATDSTSVWTSTPQTITPDTNGSALISLEGVPTDLFFNNNVLYLDAQIGTGSSLSKRIPVSTASTPANLGGYLPANPETGATENTVPVISKDGSLLLASQSPSIKATTGNLLVQGQAVTIKTADGSSGNIEINPDANGYAHFLFEGSKGNFLNAQGPNLTSGSLYYGMVPNNATGYDLIRLQSGAPKMSTKFSVDAKGNTYTAGNLNVAGNIATGGVDRLTPKGALENITGYSQNSGNFTISQNPGDSASINKTLATGSALSDVLTLTLDERGKPYPTNSDYSTLVLRRYDGNGAAAALKVDVGNAIFNGQLQLGRFSSNPGAIGPGSMVFNTTDNQVYFWDGSNWIPVGTATTVPFAGITSGTNTTANMVVGTGASLTTSGTGTITATGLNCLGCVTNANLVNSSITINSSGILSGGGTVALGGTLNLTATEADTLDSVTTRGATTTNAITVGNLTDSGLTANKGVFTDGTKQLTSTGTLGPDQGGTGFSTYTVGDLLYADTTTTLAKLADAATGNVLLSQGVGVAPIYGKVVLGTNTTGNYVSSIIGTANQITASSPTGDVTLTIPSDFRAPGTVNATTGLYTGATAGTQRIDATGNLLNIGTTQLNGVTYTWPGAATAGYVLQANNTGATSGLSWVDPATAVAASLYWNQANGVLFPKSNSTDVLIGSDSTASAKFAFTGVNGGLPTASIAGNIANVATYLTGNGNLGTTNARDLTLGGSSTGQVILNSRGTSTLIANGANITIAGDINSTAASANLFNTTTTTLNIAGAATTLNLANGNTAAVINIGNGTGGNQINVGTVVGVTNSISLGNADAATSITLSKGGTGNITFTGYNCGAFSNGGKLTTDGSGNVICAGDTSSTSSTAVKWSDLTDPDANLSLNMGNNTTTFGWTATSAINPYTINFTNSANPAGNENVLTIVNATTTNTTDTTTESLIHLDNADTTATGTTVVNDGILISNSGGITGGIVDAIDASDVGITNAISIGANNIAGNSFNVTGSNGNVLSAGNITATGDLAANSGNLTTTATTANVFTNATTLGIGAGTGTTTVNNALAVNGSSISSSQTTFSLLPGATTLNIGPTGSEASSIVMSGGSGDTGCTLNGATGDFTCSGNVTSTSTTGTQGFWTQALGTLFPTNNTVDLLIGNSATTSAKFAFTGVNNGLPTASIAGDIANVATYLTGDGTLSTTNAQGLTLGSATTGNVVINSRGSAALTANGADLTATGTVTFPNSNTLTGVANYLQNSQGFSVGGGTTYYFDGSGNINATGITGTSITDSGLTANKVVFTDGSKVLTSTGTVAAIQGGTGQTSYTIGDILYADSTTTLAKLADAATGNVLLSQGVGVAPAYGKVVLGTQTTGNYVSTITGTANQITASSSTGDITLSIPSDFRAPGTVNAVNGIYTGATAGTQRIDAAGNLLNIGTTQLHGVTYTWPAADGSSGYALTTNGSGTLSWAPASGLGTNYWNLTNGALYPQNNTVDLLIGADATTSAKFAFTGVTSTGSNVPTASIAGTVANVATYLTGNGVLSTTNARDLTLGSATTGNIILSSRGSTSLTANGANLTAAGTITLPNTNTLTGVANYLQNSQGFSVGGGTTYHFDSSGNVVANDVAANSGNLTTTSTGTATVFNTNATTLNIGGAATTMNIGPTGNGASSIVMSGGSGDTGCTLDGSNGNLTCSGTITASGGVSASSVSFAGITTGVNTQATMTVDTGASLNYTNSGTINASSLEAKTWEAPGTIGSGTPNTGAFTTLTSSGNSTIGTGASTTNTFGAGASSINTIGSTTTPGALTLHGPTTLDNTFTISGNFLTTLGGNLAVNGPTSADITTTTTTATLFNTNATTLNVGGAATTIAIGIPGASGSMSLMGGSGATGCTLDGTNGNFTCTGNIASISTTGTQGFWSQNAGALYPTNNTVDLLIGASATGSAKFAFKNILTGTPTLDVSLQATNIAVKDNTANTLQILEGSNAYLALNTTNSSENMAFGNTTTNPTFSFLGTGATTMGGNLAVNGGSLTTTQTTANLFNTTATTLNVGGAATTLNIGPTGSGASSIVMSGGSGDTGCTLNGATGDLTCAGFVAAGGVGQFGGTTATTYSRFGTTATSHGLSAVTSAQDVLVGGNIELDGVLYLDGGNISDAGGIATIIFPTNPSAVNSPNVLDDGVWWVNNTVNDGMAALMVNQSKGGAVLSASQSGIPVFTLAHVTGTAANGFTLTGAAAGSGVAEAATGSDTNIALSIDGKGTGALNLNNTGTGDVLIAGGSAATGCTITNSTGGLVCAGDITTNKTGTPTVGFWTRNTASGYLYNTTQTDNVGIGTTTPGYKLEVDTTIANDQAVRGINSAITGINYGSVFAANGSGATTNTGLYAGASGATTNYELFMPTLAAGTNNYALYSAALAQSYFAGNVGIGTTAPAAKLVVTEASTIASAIPALGASGGTFQFLSDAAEYGLIGGSTSAGSSWLQAQRIDGTATSYSLLLQPNGGNVGIGTITPTAQLSLNAAPANGARGATIVFKRADDANYGASMYGGTDGSNDFLKFNVGSGADPLAGAQTRMTILANGRVGIGMTAPNTALNVLGDISLNGGVSTSHYRINPLADQTALNLGYYVGSAWYNTGATGVPAMTIAYTGKIGIGTTTPSQALSVGTGSPFTVDNSGNITTSGTLGTSSTVNFSGLNTGVGNGTLCRATGGDVKYSTVGCTGSSRTIKHNITPINTAGLDQILQLQPVTFVYNWNTDDKVNMGFIAEDVAAVNPYFAGYEYDTDGNKKPAAIADIAVIAATVQAIKDLNGKITNLSLTDAGNLNISQDNSGNYQVTNTTNNTIIDQISAFAKVIAANIKAGAIEAQKIVTPKIQVALISPLPNTTDVTVQIGSDATPSGKFAIDNAQGNEVAAIDNEGNATFSGVVHSQNIDEITAILNQVQTDQSVLLAATDSANLNATGSAKLDQLVASDLFITNQAAINSLSVTNTLTVGSDFVIQSSDSSLNTLSSPLRLQSLAMAPIELMAGLVRIDTHGNVQIAGNLTVAGTITTPTIIISAPDATQSAVITNGAINTNSTVGKVTIPAGVNEITINNPKVTDYTMVYVTPTSSTQNNVLYVKSKQNGSFVVGFDNPVPVDVNFNWWIVNVQ